MRMGRMEGVRRGRKILRGGEESSGDVCKGMKLR